METFNKELDSKYVELFRVAVAALKAEDKVLRNAFGAKKNRYTGVAHGVTYWLFETTLVYLIFRAWIPRENVSWEHALESHPNPYAEARHSGASQKCDLMLLDENNEPYAAFEAKWWNFSSANEGLKQDADKLKQACDNLPKFLLTFWWGDQSGIENDVKKARDFCDKTGGFKLVFVGTFTTQLVKQRAPTGYFALGVIQVT